jgi:hypothetical protein
MCCSGPLVFLFPRRYDKIPVVFRGLLECVDLPVLNSLVLSIEDELAVESLRWRNALWKHCMNELSGLGMSKGKFTTGGKIPPRPADKGMLIR